MISVIKKYTFSFLILEHCTAGNYYDEQVGSCLPCGYGFYQAEEGSFNCIPCGAGLTTRRNQAVSKLECRGKFDL